MARGGTLVAGFLVAALATAVINALGHGLTSGWRASIPLVVLAAGALLSRKATAQDSRKELLLGAVLSGVGALLGVFLVH